MILKLSDAFKKRTGWVDCNVNHSPLASSHNYLQTDDLRNPNRLKSEGANSRQCWMVKNFKFQLDFHNRGSSMNSSIVIQDENTLLESSSLYFLYGWPQFVS
jgi:hypothetical protein